MQAGVYKHYKGHYYLVLGAARYTDGPQEGQWCVVYVGLELDGAKDGPRIMVRSWDDFHSWVDEAFRPRFTYIGMSVPHEAA